MDAVTLGLLLKSEISAENLRSFERRMYERSEVKVKGSREVSDAKY